MYQLDNISCAYDERLIFENVNLTIKKETMWLFSERTVKEKIDFLRPFDGL